MAGQRRFTGKGQGLAAIAPVISNDRRAGGERGNYNPGLNNEDDKPQVRYGSMQTYERPLVLFPADVVITPGAVQQVQVPIPDRTMFMRFINVAGAFGDVTASINGGGFRAILNLDMFTNCEINSLVVQCSAAGGCTIQTAQI